MLKSHKRKFAQIAAVAALFAGTPAMALSGAEEAEFDSEMGEARSKMMGQSAAALEHARNARKIARGESVRAKRARLTATWLEAQALMRLNRSGEASPMIRSTLNEAAGSFHGSKLHADLLCTQGSLQARSGQFAEALPALLEAQTLYEALGENRSQAIVLINIGSLYSGARQFDKALGYFERGQKAFPKDPSLSLSAHNNIGNALKGLARYSEAESAFGRALETAPAKDSPLLTARILTNIAAVQVADGRAQSAKASALEAMEIAKEHAPDWARFVDGVLAQVELANGDLTKAQTHIERAFEGENLGETAAHFHDFHETAADLYTQMGDTNQSDLHTSALTRLNANVAQIDG